MKPALILIAILLVSGLLLYLHDRATGDHSDSPADDAAASNDTQSCSTDCCSTNSVCPSQTILDAIGCAPVYFNDEELDAFRGREANSYSDDETEQFRDVLYTLKPNELLPWQRSIKKRGIILPAAIHDEFIMLYNENSTMQ